MKHWKAQTLNIDQPFAQNRKNNKFNSKLVVLHASPNESIFQESQVVIYILDSEILV